MIGKYGITGSARLYRQRGDIRIGGLRPCTCCNKVFVATRTSQNNRVFVVCQSCGHEGEKAEDSKSAIDYWNATYHRNELSKGD